MSGVYLTGLPINSGVEHLLRENFGYSPIVMDEKWFIKDTDPGLPSRTLDILQLYPEVDLRNGAHRRASEEMLTSLSDDYEQLNHGDFAPDHISILGGLGLLSDVEKVLHEILFQPWSALADVFSSSLLPLMTENFKVEYVLPMSLRANRQQSFFSLAKAGLLAQRGNAVSAKAAVVDRGAFQGIEMRGGLSVLAFVDALTRLIPVYFSLPVHRLGCAWHFYSEGPRIMPSLATRGLFQQFNDKITPRSNESTIVGLKGLRKLSNNEVLSFLKFVVRGINRLMSYLNDFRNFTNDRNEVDWLKQLQTYGNIHMFFADLIAISHTTDPHSQFVMSFGLLDKIANLKKHVGMLSESEPDIFNMMMSVEQGEEIKRLVNIDISPFDNGLASAIEKLIGTCYRDLHKDLSEQMMPNACEEGKRRNRMRAFRNLHHGTFLRRLQFEELFLSGRATIPNSLVTLPFVLSIGLISDPVMFFKYSSA